MPAWLGAAQRAQPTMATSLAQDVATRLGISVEKATRALSEFGVMPGALTPRTPEKDLASQYWSLTIEERQRFNYNYHIESVHSGADLTAWIKTQTPTRVIKMLDDLKSHPLWLLQPTPQQGFWDILGKVILRSEAYDDAVLAPILARSSREVYNFTQDQYDAAVKYLTAKWGHVVDLDRMRDIVTDPAGFDVAVQQRADFQAWTTTQNSSRLIEQEYFQYKTWGEQKQWELDNPAEWKLLQKFWDEKATMKFGNPYMSYFFYRDDYNQHFQGRDPAQVQENITAEKASYDQATRDMARYNAGIITEWTPGMEKWRSEERRVGKECRL